MVDVIAQLRQQAQAGGWLRCSTQAADPYSDVHGLYHGQADLLLFPDSTAAVAQIMRFCHQHQVRVVIQGGNTGYCGGAIPVEADYPQILLSLRNLNQIRSLDLTNQSMTVDAGCTLGQIQEKVAHYGRWFPLGLSVADRCLIGGNLATNAGGVNVLRYGNVRDLVLGVEAVLANGDIYHGLQRLRKNNSGYDLKNMFIGSEGSLGIITGAVLKLYPALKSRALALVGFDDFDQALVLLEQLQQGYQENLSAFEYWQGRVLAQVQMCFDQFDLPFKTAHSHYLLLELSGQHPQDFLSCLEAELGRGAWEYVVTQDAEMMQHWWQFRAHLPKAQQQVWAHLNSGIKHDIALPIDKIALFMMQMPVLLQDYLPELKTAVFGHLGDGNLHFNVGTENICLSAEEIGTIQALVYQQVQALGGSFSAEHGIGQAKVHLLQQYADPCGLALMRQLKGCFDPLCLLNPSKVL